VTFIDHYFRKVWVYLFKRKADVFNTFKQFRALVEKRIDGSIKCLRTYNGCDFTSVEFENYCKEDGIEIHKTMIYTPRENGFVECMNKNLLERTRNMLSNAKMQQELWRKQLLQHVI
jgi:transposase InsO family protein